MTEITRRAVLKSGAGLSAALLLAGCTTQSATVSRSNARPAASAIPPGTNSSHALMYGPIYTERFPVAAVDLSTVNPAFLRAEIDYATNEAPGTIIVDPTARYLYHVQPGGRATRYGVGV